MATSTTKRAENAAKFGGDSYRQDAFSPVRKTVKTDLIEPTSSGQHAGLTTDATDRSRAGGLLGYQASEARRHNQPVLAKRLNFYGTSNNTPVTEDFADASYESVAFKASQSFAPPRSNNAYYEPIQSQAARVYTPEKRRYDNDSDYDYSGAKGSHYEPYDRDRGGVLSASRFGGACYSEDAGPYPGNRALDESAISQGDMLIAAKQKRLMSA